MVITAYTNWGAGWGYYELSEVRFYEAESKAIYPYPADNAEDVSPKVVLSWFPGAHAAQHKVYFGTESGNLPLVTAVPQPQDPNTYNAGAHESLEANKTYYWRVDGVNGLDATPGDEWSFTTLGLTACNKDPYSREIIYDLDKTLSWQSGAFAASHNVYFGTSFADVNNPAPMATDIDGNGRVDFGDVKIVSLNWLTDGSGGGDLNGNNDVNNVDFTMLAADWRKYAGQGTIFKGTQDANTYDPGTLELNKTYYWRIDEVNEPYLWRGNVWSFRTSPVNDAYGINTHVVGSTAAERTLLFNRVKEAGIGWIRCDFNWYAIEQSQDNYQFATHDAIVAEADARGIQIFATLSHTPQWATSGVQPYGVPNDPADWYDFVYTVVSRYKNSVKHWGMWNEPDSMFDGTRQQYIDMILKTGADTAHAADPTAQVCGPEITGANSGWLEDCIIQAGSKLDVVTFHLYDPGGPDFITNSLQSWVKNALNNVGWTGPFWLTEIGWRAAYVGEVGQAQNYPHMLSNWYTGKPGYDWLDKIFFYELYDDPLPSYLDALYGIVSSNSTEPEFRRKPGFYAYKDSDFNYAYQPAPADGISVGVDEILTWQSGLSAAAHNVYFGTDINAVDNGSSSVYQGNFTDPEFTPPAMTLDTTYYWRIDETDGSNIWGGQVWSFTTRPNADNYLVGWWELDESSGSASDSTGNTNTGTLYGNPIWYPSDGKIDGALQFDGDDYVLIVNESNFDFTGPFSIALWIKYNAVPIQGFHPIISKSGSAWIYYMGNFRTFFRLHNADAAPQEPWYAILWGDQNYVHDYQWHHVTLVYDGVKLYEYLDNELNSFTGASITISTNDYSVALGYDQEDNDFGFIGRMDDVRIYNCALSPVDVNELATVTSP